MPLLLKLFNHMLHEEYFPKTWSDGFIVPLFKSGDKDEPSNYRGLTIASCLGKLFTKILNIRLVEFLEDNKILSSNQIGFRKKQRTSDHILVVKTIIDSFRAKRKPLYICFVDLRKAFDTVWRDGLIYKLIKYKISSKFINIIKSMYSNVQASVKTGDGLTDKFPIEIGTRQGCNLSPSLFNVFINDLPQILLCKECDYIEINNTKLNCLMFADDILMFSKSETGMATCLKKLESFCNKWKLIINTTKTKIMVLNRKKKETSKFKVYNKTIESVNSYSYLGVEFSSSGSFSLAIKRLYNKACKAYFSLRQEFNFYNNTSPSVILKLFDTMIKPIMLYGSEIWGCFLWRKNDITSINKQFYCLTQKFESLQIKVCKNALGLQRNAPNLTALAELGRYPLMGDIIKNIVSYWQYILSKGEDSLLPNCLGASIGLDRNNIPSYYSRIKSILAALDCRFCIYKVPEKQIRQYSNDIRKKYREQFTAYFFEQIAAGAGRFEIYKQLKFNYGMEKYLVHVRSAKLWRYITQIRTSNHPFPIETLRKKGIPREQRVCHMCKSGCIGSEFHLLFQCQNEELKKYRDTFLDKIHNLNHEISKLTHFCLFLYLMSAVDSLINFRFAIFLEKVFHATKSAISI